VSLSVIGHAAAFLLPQQWDVRPGPRMASSSVAVRQRTLCGGGRGARPRGGGGTSFPCLSSTLRNGRSVLKRFGRILTKRLRSVDEFRLQCSQIADFYGRAPRGDGGSRRPTRAGRNRLLTLLAARPVAPRGGPLNSHRGTHSGVGRRLRRYHLSSIPVTRKSDPRPSHSDEGVRGCRRTTTL
jgi:hypothetical protein